MFRFLDENFKFKTLTPENYLKIFEVKRNRKF